jgi:hypothetical protein
MGDTSEELAVRITETVSDTREKPLEELPPLVETIDPDALAVIIPSSGTASQSDVTVTFSYAGLHVFVCPGNTIYVRPPPDDCKGEMAGSS